MRNDLKKARCEKGLTQGDLADKIGKSQSVVSRYESGDSPIDTATAPLIAAALGLSIIEVLYPASEQESPRSEAA